jgi:putative spermidine/putrescine transport system ATP-binding protein
VALDLVRISKHYGSSVALSDVSLSVASGEFICLLGASGCGKTTLLRIIAGLVKHDQGEILLDGNDLSAVPCHQRNIGMVFQSLALFPHIDVGENIAYGLKMRGVNREARQKRAAQLLSLVGLSGFEQRAVSSLSGGQRQRVAIARALALEPQLFLMDEPFSALDAGLRDRLQVEVRKLQRDLGVTTVFVTHDQREAMALADRIVILNNGRVEQAATPSEIYKYPASRFVAEFIGENNLFEVDINGSEVTFAGQTLDTMNHVMQGLQGSRLLAIRPEQIEVRLPPPGYRGLTGQLLQQRQIGALAEREIDVAGSLVKQTLLQHHAAEIPIGQSVAISWDWQQAWVIPQ